jgi:CRP-like cAMP-binding protein
MLNWRQHFGDGTRRKLGVADVLFRREDPIVHAYLVVSGQVAMERGLASGHPLVLAEMRDGQLLAEASLFVDHYHCDAVARAPTELLVLEKTTLLERLNTVPGTGASLLAETSREVQRLRSRIEILRLNRVADRLTAWLDLYGPPGKGGWVTVAESIGVTPEALYRELAKRRIRSGK